MKIKREVLQTALEQAKSAVAVNGAAGMDCFWFDGNAVTAYNDVIGIECPLETDFEGGVNGRLLLGYLSKIETEEVALQLIGEEIVISAGRGHMTIPLLDMDKCPWRFPEPPEDEPAEVFWGAPIPFTENLRSMLKWLLLSVSKNSSISEHLGVTMIYSKVLHLWTTDAKTISWARVELPEASKLPRITVPSAFFDEMLSLADDGDVFHVSDKSAMTANQSGVRLFSRLLEVDRPLNFSGVTKKSNPGNAVMIPIPDGLGSALDRAGLIREGKNAEPVQINIREGHFDLYLRTPLGEVKDRMDLEGEHNEVSAKFDPSLIARSLEDRSSFLVTSNALIMTGPDAFTCFVSTLQS